jgi:hypothetical protein
LLSLLLVFLTHPLLDHGRLPRLILGILTFAPLVFATVRMAHIKRLVWPVIIVIVSAIVAAIAGAAAGSLQLFAVHRALLALAFAMTVVGLFSYLLRATAITAGHLFTAISVYLLLAMAWFAIYSAVAAIQPDSFQQTLTGATSRPADLLYFSLATLTTLGYGDIVPVGGEIRMLATLEAAAGVLYVAITVALLVSSYKARPS